MLRLAKPANYIAVSPGIQQRARYWKTLSNGLFEPTLKCYVDVISTCMYWELTLVCVAYVTSLIPRP